MAKTSVMVAWSFELYLVVKALVSGSDIRGFKPPSPKIGSGDTQTLSTNDEAELQEQPRADDVDEEEGHDPPDWEK